jgi:hypothetical protein
MRTNQTTDKNEMGPADRFNIDAPIFPGSGAAGLCLGEPVAPILDVLGHLFTVIDLSKPGIEPHYRRYNSEMVDLWELDGMVDQIMVHHEYRGTYAGLIGIGSSLADIRRCFGRWFENDVDEFEIEGVEGMCFDIASYPLPSDDPAFLLAPISHICVFRIPNGQDGMTIQQEQP